MRITRRQFLEVATAIVAVPSLSSVAWTQSYPTRSVRVIVPYAAGSAVDIIARIIGAKLSKHLGQQFYVENLPAGASNVGIRTAARAPADGYSILFVSTTFVINPSLYANIAYNPIEDFTPVSLVATSPNALVVHPSLGVNNVKELVDLVKANPGKYTYATAGRGQSTHIAAELFKLSFGLDLEHVPFNGGGPAVIDNRRTYTDCFPRASSRCSTHQGGHAAGTCRDKSQTRPTGSERANSRGGGCSKPRI